METNSKSRLIVVPDQGQISSMSNTLFVATWPTSILELSLVSQAHDYGRSRHFLTLPRLVCCSAPSSRLQPHDWCVRGSSQISVVRAKTVSHRMGYLLPVFLLNYSFFSFRAIRYFSCLSFMILVRMEEVSFQSFVRVNLFLHFAIKGDC